MKTILSSHTVDINELKKTPSKFIKGNETIAILDDNTPCAYLVPCEIYEKMIDIIDDYFLAQEVKEVLEEGKEPIEVDIDKL